MARSRRSPRDEIEQLLEGLPDGFSVTPIGAARFIVGRTGAHVVLAHDGSPERGRALARLAATVRSALAERLTWVPFVHPLLVGGCSPSAPLATVVLPDLLVEVLTEGRRSLEVETIERIEALIAEGVLDGLASVAPAVVDARMAGWLELPVPVASTSSSTISGPTRAERPPSSRTPPASTGWSGHRSRDT